VIEMVAAITANEVISREDYSHIHYVQEKLKEAEDIAGNPGEWMDLADLFKQWDEWEAVKA
jgi:hypothetical protein